MNMKFKYRIITNNNTEYPFTVQRGIGFIWWHLLKTGSEQIADEIIKSRIENSIKRKVKPRVIKEYTEADYLVDKLKGNV